MNYKNLIPITLLAQFLCLSSCYKNDINEIIVLDDMTNDRPSDSTFQRQVFADEFNGRDVEDNKFCYDIEPKCTVRLDWGSEGACPKDMKVEQFKDLNKCNWNLWAGFGFWDGSNRSAYHPNQVKIIKDNEAGYLRLSGKWRKDKSAYNCGYKESAPNGQMTDCIFDFGGVDSKQFSETNHGRSFKYGKIAIRARISSHQNLYPALWTWPENINKGHPYQFDNWNDYLVNEIDILESRNAVSGKFDAWQTLHDWKCPPGTTGSCNIWESKTNYTLRPNSWYVFGATREIHNGKKRIRFFIDDTYTLTINEGDPAYSGSTHLKKIFEIGSTPLFLIFSLGSSFINPNYAQMDGMNFDVDWVRIYED